MTIQAEFIGQNTLGYENGKKYFLTVSDFNGMSVKRMDGTGECPYQSLSSFLKNWNNIKILY